MPLCPEPQHASSALTWVVRSRATRGPSHSSCGAAWRHRSRGRLRAEGTTPPQPGPFIPLKSKQRLVAQMQSPPHSVEPPAPSGVLWEAGLAILECFTGKTGAQISLRFFLILILCETVFPALPL